MLKPPSSRTPPPEGLVSWYGRFGPLARLLREGRRGTWFGPDLLAAETLLKHSCPGFQFVPAFARVTLSGPGRWYGFAFPKRDAFCDLCGNPVPFDDAVCIPTYAFICNPENIEIAAASAGLQPIYVRNAVASGWTDWVVHRSEVANLKGVDIE